MTFINPDIPSSYQRAEMGRVLYDVALEVNAKRIVDIGVLFGYSTVCLAMAARETNGIVYAYDLFDEYEYNHADINDVCNNLKKYRLDDFVVIEKLSFGDWLERKDEFDLLHLDISNTGTTIETLAKNLGEFKGRVLFEGGSKQRDLQDWVVEYNMKKINDIDVPFKVLAEDFYYDENDKRTYYPSISELMR